jgi:hypothetical protein
MLNDHTHANRVLRQLGIDPSTVLEHGADETGYLVLGRHPDGEFLMTDDGPVLSRVPWPTRDDWFRFQEADRIDRDTVVTNLRRRDVAILEAAGVTPDDVALFAKIRVQGYLGSQELHQLHARGIDVSPAVDWARSTGKDDR